MNASALATCFAFLEKLPKEKREPLLHFLSADQKKNMCTFSEDLTQGFPPIEEELPHIHQFLDYLEEEPQPLATL